MPIPDEITPEPTVLVRAANAAARAVVKVIEEHTGQSVTLYDSMRLVQCLGASLERNGIDGGPPGSIRIVLEQPVKPRVAVEMAPPAPGDDEVDELYADALSAVLQSRRASTSIVQRRLRIGYNRAARLMELMEKRGAVGPENGSSPREILIPA